MKQHPPTSGANIYDDGTYLSNNPDWHALDSPFKAKNVGDILDSAELQVRSLLEIGCGSGEILVQLAKRYPDCDFLGVDTATSLEEFWRDRRAPNIRFSCLDAMLMSEVFDVAMMLDVFEHVPDYIGFLEKSLPLARYFVFNIPLDLYVAGLMLGHIRSAREEYGHLHYFSPESAVSTLELAGYRVLDKFIAPGFKGAPKGSVRTTMKQRLIYFPRLVSFGVSPAWSQRLFGGSSLVVLAEAADSSGLKSDAARQE
jgi:SAM-dependent methyltransferase